MAVLHVVGEAPGRAPGLLPDLESQRAQLRGRQQVVDRQDAVGQLHRPGGRHAGDLDRQLVAVRVARIADAHPDHRLVRGDGQLRVARGHRQVVDRLDVEGDGLGGRSPLAVADQVGQGTGGAVHVRRRREGQAGQLCRRQHVVVGDLLPGREPDGSAAVAGKPGDQHRQLVAVRVGRAGDVQRDRRGILDHRDLAVGLRLRRLVGGEAQVPLQRLRGEPAAIADDGGELHIASVRQNLDRHGARAGVGQADRAVAQRIGAAVAQSRQQGHQVDGVAEDAGVEGRDLVTAVVGRPVDENIHAVAAVEAVAAEPAVERVVAGIARQPVVTHRAEQGVVAESAAQRVVVGPAVQAVVAGAAVQPVKAEAAFQAVRPVAAVQGVVAVLALQRVVVRVAEQCVVARTAAQKVVAGAAEQPGGALAVIVGRGVVALAAVQRVVAGAAVQRVAAFTAEKAVVAGAAEQRVVPGQTVDRVVAADTIDGFRRRRAAQRVVARRSALGVEGLGEIRGGQAVLALQLDHHVARGDHAVVVHVHADAGHGGAVRGEPVVEDIDQPVVRGGQAGAGPAHGNVEGNAPGEGKVAAGDGDLQRVRAGGEVGDGRRVARRRHRLHRRGGLDLRQGPGLAEKEDVRPGPAGQPVAAAGIGHQQQVVAVAAVEGVRAVGPVVALVRATIERVVAGPAEQNVRPGPAVQAVVLRPAVQAVVTDAGVEAVGAVPAQQGVVALVTVERVVAGAAGYEVGAGVAGQVVGAVTAVQAVVPGPAGQEVPSVAAQQGIVAGPAVEVVVLRAAVEAVVARPAVQLIVARPAQQGVVAGPAIQAVAVLDVRPVGLIGARAAVDDVVAVAAFQQVHVVAAVQAVVPGPAHQRIGAVGPHEGVVAADAVDDVAAAGADEAVGAGRAAPDDEGVAEVRFGEGVNPLQLEDRVGAADHAVVVEVHLDPRVAAHDVIGDVHEPVVGVARVDRPLAGEGQLRRRRDGQREGVAARGLVEIGDDQRGVAGGRVVGCAVVADAEQVAARTAGQTAAAGPGAFQRVVAVPAVQAVPAPAGPQHVVARLAIDGVVALVAGQVVVAVPTVEGIVAGPAVEVVVPGPAGEEIVAVPGRQEVGPRAAVQRVAPLAADQPVVAVVAVEAVVAGPAVQPVVAAAAAQRVVAGLAVQADGLVRVVVGVIVPVAAVEEVVAVPAVQVVDAVAAIQAVVAVPAVQRVVVRAARQAVAAAAAVEPVAPVATVQAVVAGPAVQRVVAGAADQRVVATDAIQDVGFGGADQTVVAGTPALGGEAVGEVVGGQREHAVEPDQQVAGPERAVVIHVHGEQRLPVAVLVQDVDQTVAAVAERPSVRPEGGLAGPDQRLGDGNVGIVLVDRNLQAIAAGNPGPFEIGDEAWRAKTGDGQTGNRQAGSSLDHKQVVAGPTGQRVADGRSGALQAQRVVAGPAVQDVALGGAAGVGIGAVARQVVVAIAAQQGVASGGPVQRVVSGAALQPVVACLAVEAVVAGAAEDEVVAVLARQVLIIAVAAVERVVAKAAVEVVGTVAALQPVVARLAVEDVASGSATDEVRPAAGIDLILAVARVDGVVPVRLVAGGVAAVDVVVAGAAQDAVVARSAVEAALVAVGRDARVVAVAAVERVVPGAAAQPVAAVAADEAVVARVALDIVVAAMAQQGVVAGDAVQAVGVVRPVKPVRAGRAALGVEGFGEVRRGQRVRALEDDQQVLLAEDAVVVDVDRHPGVAALVVVDDVGEAVALVRELVGRGVGDVERVFAGEDQERAGDAELQEIAADDPAALEIGDGDGVGRRRRAGLPRPINVARVGIEGEDVAAGPARQRVAATDVADIQDIVAVVAVQDVDLGPAVEPVVAGPAAQGVGPDEPVHLVVGAVADQNVRQRVALHDDRVGTVDQGQVLDVDQPIGAKREHVLVGERLCLQPDLVDALVEAVDQTVVQAVEAVGVVADAAVQRVGAPGAVQDVVAVRAPDDVGERVAGAAQRRPDERQILDLGGQRVVHAGDHEVLATGRAGVGVVGQIAEVVHVIEVVAGAAGQRVGPGPAIERVVARTAGQEVVAAVAVQPIVAGEAKGGVVAGRADDPVARTGQVRPFEHLYAGEDVAVGVAAGHRSRTDVDGHRGRGRFIGQHVDPGAAVDAVGAGPAVQHVVAVAAQQRVAAVVPFQEIAVRPAVQAVVPGAGEQVVHPGAARQRGRHRRGGVEDDLVVLRATVADDARDAGEALLAAEALHRHAAAGAGDRQGFGAVGVVAQAPLAGAGADVERQDPARQRPQDRRRRGFRGGLGRRVVGEVELRQRDAGRGEAPDVVAADLDEGGEAGRDQPRGVEDLEGVGDERLGHLVHVDAPVVRRAVDVVVQVEVDGALDPAAAAGGGHADAGVDDEVERRLDDGFRHVHPVRIDVADVQPVEDGGVVLETAGDELAQAAGVVAEGEVHRDPDGALDLHVQAREDRNRQKILGRDLEAHRRQVEAEELGVAADQKGEGAGRVGQDGKREAVAQQHALQHVLARLPRLGIGLRPAAAVQTRQEGRQVLRALDDGRCRLGQFERRVADVRQHLERACVQIDAVGVGAEVEPAEIFGPGDDVVDDADELGQRDQILVGDGDLDEVQQRDVAVRRVLAADVGAGAVEQRFPARKLLQEADVGAQHRQRLVDRLEDRFELVQNRLDEVLDDGAEVVMDVFELHHRQRAEGNVLVVDVDDAVVEGPIDHEVGAGLRQRGVAHVRVEMDADVRRAAEGGVDEVAVQLRQPQLAVVVRVLQVDREGAVQRGVPVGRGEIHQPQMGRGVEIGRAGVQAQRQLRLCSVGLDEEAGGVGADREVEIIIQRRRRRAAGLQLQPGQAQVGGERLFVLVMLMGGEGERDFGPVHEGVDGVLVGAQGFQRRVDLVFDIGFRDALGVVDDVQDVVDGADDLAFDRADALQRVLALLKGGGKPVADDGKLFGKDLRFQRILDHAQGVVDARLECLDLFARDHSVRFRAVRFCRVSRHHLPTLDTATGC